MAYNQAIDSLKQHIAKKYIQNTKKIKTNIYRGNSRSLSSDVEEEIAIFCKTIMPKKYKYYIDVSIHEGGKNHKPDLLIVNTNGEVVAMIEIKANMGYCRNAGAVIDKLHNNDKVFKEKNELLFKIHDGNKANVKYGNNVKLFLIALTRENCDKNSHKKNRLNASKASIKYFTLFDGWYDNLSNNEIINFANELQKL